MFVNYVIHLAKHVLLLLKMAVKIVLGLLKKTKENVDVRPEINLPGPTLVTLLRVSPARHKMLNAMQRMVTFLKQMYAQELVGYAKQQKRVKITNVVKTTPRVAGEV